MEGQIKSSINKVNQAEKIPDIEKVPKMVDDKLKKNEENTNENVKKIEVKADENVKKIVEQAGENVEKIEKKVDETVKKIEEMSVKYDDKYLEEIGCEGEENRDRKKKKAGRHNMRLPSSNNMVDYVRVPGTAKRAAKVSKPSTEKKSKATSNKKVQPKVDAKLPKDTMKAAKGSATGDAGNKKKKERKAVRTEIYDVQRSSTGSDTEALDNERVGWFGWLWATIRAFLGF